MKTALKEAGFTQPLPVCPYCNTESKLTTGEEVYPRRKDLKKLIFYVCTPCGARVGCHPNTDTPLGGLANLELRKWRMETHKVFDTLWKDKGLTRTKAYTWLCSKLSLTKKECHIGKFTIKECKRTIKYCKGYEE